MNYTIELIELAPKLNIPTILSNYFIVHATYKMTKNHQWPMSHICNPSYYRSGGSWFKGIPGKKFMTLPSHPIAGHSSTYLSFQAMQEAEIGRITVPN
jgi:hypothetical protein